MVSDAIRFSDTEVILNKRAFQKLIHFFKEDSETVHRSIHLHYLIVLGGYHGLLKQSLEKFGYKPWLETEFSPIKLALELNNREILDVFADYTENSPTIEFDFDVLSRGLRSTSRKFRSAMVRRFIREGRSTVDLPYQLPKVEKHFNMFNVTANPFQGSETQKLVSDYITRNNTKDTINVRYMNTTLKGEYTVGN